MKLFDLIRICRNEGGDLSAPPLWARDDLVGYANEAEREACRRALLITDSSTYDLCTLAVSAGDPVVNLPAKIIDVMRARLDSQKGTVLGITTVAELDACSPGWEDQTGTPICYVTDWQTDVMRLYPTPLKGDVLKISVHRLPAKDLAEDDDTPEIREEYQPALVYWMLHRAYMIHDAELFDPAKSERALANFEREFGRRSSARNETWARTRNTEFAPPLA